MANLKVIGGTANSQDLNDNFSNLDAQLAENAQAIGVNVENFPIISPEIDDTARVRRAIEKAVNNGGDAVVFAAKEYVYSGSVELFDHVMLIGKSGTGFKLTDGTNDALYLHTANHYAWFYANTKIDIKIFNINFDGGLQTVLFDAIALRTCTNLYLDGLMIKSVNGSAIVLDASQKFIVDNIIIENITGQTGNPGEGIFGAGIKNGLISNIIGIGLDDHLIYISGDSTNFSSDIQLSNLLGESCGRNKTYTNGSSAFNVFKDCRRISIDNAKSYNSGMGFRVHCDDGNTVMPVDITLSNCEAYNSNGTYGHGFSVKGLVGVEMRLKLDNCKSFESGKGTTDLARGFSFTNVLNFELYDITANGSNSEGITFDKCEGLKWVGGSVEGNGVRHGSAVANGIQIGLNTRYSTTNTECTDFYIAEVSTTDRNTTKKQRTGVKIDAECTNIFIRNGKHIGNAVSPYELDAGTETTCKVLGVDVDGYPI